MIFRFRKPNDGSSTARRVVLWITFSGVVLAEIHGFASTGILRQEGWSATGLSRWMWFSILYAGWTILTVRWFPRFCFPVIAAVALAWTVLSAGVIPLLAVLLFLAASWKTGRLFLSSTAGCEEGFERELLAIILGAAIYSLLQGLLAHLPINYPLTALALLAAPFLYEYRSVRLPIATLTTGHRRVQAAMAVIAFPILAHLLAALMPEVSTDGLAMHLTIPSFVAHHHYWNFDFREAFWAFMPMGGDWCYTLVYLLGGEAAARLLNFGFLVVIAALVFATSRRHLEIGPAAILTAMFVSTPLARIVTGSLFVENFWTACILGAFVALWRFKGTGARAEIYSVATLLGAAVSAKFAALPIAGVLMPLALWETARKRPAKASIVVALFILFALQPYLVAQLKTGNPVFPFFNNIFASPHNNTAFRSTDVRFETPISWRSLYDLTFHTDRFLEAPAGAAGFQYLLLLPLGLIALRRSSPPAGWICLVGACLSGWAIFSVQSNVRYLYAVMPLITIGFGVALAQYKAETRILYRAIVASCLILFSVNCFFWGIAGGLHRDFWLNPFDDSERQRYVEYFAPARILIEYLNATAPGEPVAFVGTNHIAGLHAKALSSTWHHKPFADRLDNATSPREILSVAHEYGIRRFVAPSVDSAAILLPAFAPFAGTFTEPELQSGSFYIWKLKPEFEGDEGLQRAGMAAVTDPAQFWRTRGAASPGQTAPAQRGDYDDADHRLVFYGPWEHSNQYPHTLNTSISYSNVIGASVEFIFSGAEITYVYTGGFNRGKARVTLDGVEEILDQYVPQIEWQKKKTWSGLRPGVHKLQISVLPERNSASEGFYVDIDALFVR